MAEEFDPKDLVTLEELAISNMWETSALVELLERKGMPTVRSPVLTHIPYHVCNSLNTRRYSCVSRVVYLVYHAGVSTYNPLLPTARQD